MKNIQNSFVSLPKRIADYDLITQSTLSIPIDRQSFIQAFDSVSKGALEEVLISYDNHTTRFSMRVRGRGHDLKLHLEYMRIIYDTIGPITAETLEEKVIHDWDFEISIQYLLSWIEEKTGVNL